MQGLRRACPGVGRPNTLHKSSVHPSSDTQRQSHTLRTIEDEQDAEQVMWYESFVGIVKQLHNPTVTQGACVFCVSRAHVWQPSCDTTTGHCEDCFDTASCFWLIDTRMTHTLQWAHFTRIHVPKDVCVCVFNSPRCEGKVLCSSAEVSLTTDTQAANVCGGVSSHQLHTSM